MGPPCSGWSIARTRARREQLRRRLTTMAPSADAIHQLQRAHRTLAEDAAVSRALVDRCDTDGVERYLNSNWQLPDARSPLTNLANQLRRPVWFSEYLRDVGSGPRGGTARRRAPARRSLDWRRREHGGQIDYLAEVRRIKTLALALSGGRPAIAVLDEPFRGTIVQDAVEATLAVLTRLAGHRSALVFVASHLGEVVPAISGDSRIRLLHFAADLTVDRPRFDYRQRDGMSAQRLGMTRLRQEEVLHLLEDSGSSSPFLTGNRFPHRPSPAPCRRGSAR